MLYINYYYYATKTARRKTSKAFKLSKAMEVSRIDHFSNICFLLAWNSKGVFCGYASHKASRKRHLYAVRKLLFCICFGTTPVCSVCLSLCLMDGWFGMWWKSRIKLTIIITKNRKKKNNWMVVQTSSQSILCHTLN